MHSKETIFLLIPFSIFSTLSASQTFSAIFGFGDIGADTGNNNFLRTYLRSNFKPYGRQYPNKTPTGRFNDGRVPIDFICMFFGLKNGFMPPYLNNSVTTDQELLTGTNFACGGSGLDPDTAKIFKVLSLPNQINLFEEALGRIHRLVGEERKKSIIANALYLISGGTADTILYYNSLIKQSRFNYNISRFQDFLLQQLDGNLQRLYNMGARRFLVSNLPPIGCFPIQITLNGRIPRKCIEQQNEESLMYNAKFRGLVSRLESQVLPNSRIVTAEVFDNFFDIFTNPSKFGFEVALRGCCGSGLYEIGLLCKEPFVTTCPDPNKYVIWDALNPTNKTYSILSEYFIQALRSRFS